MPAYDVPVRFVVNDKQFQTAVDSSTAALNRMGKEYEDVVKAQREQIGTEKRLGTEVKRSLKATVDYLAKTGQLPKEVKRIASEYVRYQEALRMARLEQLRLQAAGAQGTAAYAAQGKAIKQNIALLDTLRMELAGAIQANERAASSRAMGGPTKAIADMKNLKTASNGTAKAMVSPQGIVGVLNNLSFKLFVITFAAKQMFETLLRGFVQSGEAVLLFEKRVEMLTGSREAIQPLYDVAFELGVKIEEVANGFTRFAVANTTMKRTQQELVGMTRTVLAFGLASGSSLQEASSGLQQLGQGLASNRLQGDELRSVFENLPLLAVELAKRLGTTIAGLREMGAAGKLTGDVVSQALIDAGERADDLIMGLQSTTTRAINNLSTAWSLMIRDVLVATGGESGFVAVFDQLTDAVRSFGEFVTHNMGAINAALSAAAEAAKAFLAIFIGSRVFAALASLAKLASALALVRTALGAIAAGNLAAGLGVTLGILANPVVAGAIVVLGAAIYGVSKALKENNELLEVGTENMDDYIKKVKEMTLVEQKQLLVQEKRKDAAQLTRFYELRGQLDQAIATQSAPGGGRTGVQDQRQQRVIEATAALREHVVVMGTQLERTKALDDAISGNTTRTLAEARAVEGSSKAYDDLQKVLEKLNPELKQQREYLEDLDTLWDNLSADNVDQIVDAMQRLEDNWDAALGSIAMKNAEMTKGFEEVAAAAKKAGVDVRAAYALWMNESLPGRRNDPKTLGPVTRSGARAESPFQMMPGTYKQYTSGRLLDKPFGEQAEIALRHFRDLLDMFNGNLEQALAAYHGGPGAVKKDGGIRNVNDGYSTTPDYAARGMATFRSLGGDPSAVITGIREMTDAEREYKTLIEGMATPLEKYNATLARYNDLKAQGLLVGDDYLRAVSAAQDAFRDEATAIAKASAAQVAYEESSKALAATNKTRAEAAKVVSDMIVAGYTEQQAKALEAAQGTLALSTALDALAVPPEVRAILEGEAMKGLNKSLEDAADATREFGLAMESAFSKALADGAQMRDVLKGLITDMLQLIAKQTILKGMEAGVGALFDGNAATTFGSAFVKGLTGAKAKGGPTIAGGTYLVGEEGPEIITTKAAGTVIPNGGGLLNVTINNNAPGVDVSARQDGGGLTIDVVRATLAADLSKGGQSWTRALDGRTARGW